MEELDRQVAEALGWKVNKKLFRGYYYEDQDGGFHSKCLFKPSTNGQQAMDLVREFNIGVMPYEHREGKSCDKYFIAYWTHPIDSAHFKHHEEGPTPEIAICRAIVASKGGSDD